MAYTLSRYLRLRLDSNLTANSAYNLSKLDLLGSVFQTNTVDAVVINSRTDITLLPESQTSGGSGDGGVVNIGLAGQQIDAFNVYADAFNFSSPLGLLDQASGGTKYLRLEYDSALSGSVDTVADRALSIDLNGANRQLILAGNLSVLGGYAVALSATAATAVTLPTTGTLATLAGTESLSNKTLVSPRISGALVLNESGSGGNTVSISAGNVPLDYGVVMPLTQGGAGQTLINDGAGNLEWAAVLAIADQSANTVFAGPVSGAADDPAFRALVSDDLPSGISATKIGGGNVSSTEFDYLDGVTSGIQSQLDNKQALDADLTALAGLSSAGMIARTGSGTAAVRTITAGAGISIADGNGVSGNPTITSTVSQYTDEMAQDAVGGILVDTASINATYDDSTPQITFDVIPGGVDHNSLLNYSANRHIDHAAVSIVAVADGGLSGGGTIAATRNLAIDPGNAPSVSVASADILMIGDASNLNSLARTTVSAVLALTGRSFSEDWTSGSTHTSTHNLGTRDVIVQLYSLDTFETLDVTSVVRTDINTVDLTASQAPGGTGWRVLIRSL